MIRLRPSYWLAVAAVPLAGILLFKLNKQDFYRHYFRVIAEVAARNSQSCEAASPLAVFSAEADDHQAVAQPVPSIFPLVSAEADRPSPALPAACGRSPFDPACAPRAPGA
ncbi:MAG: hypothetical protein NW241_15650 [Bacteroidia bacterium]|nr:hypothetical protein [Bacteroidia bacterium]